MTKTEMTSTETTPTGSQGTNALRDGERQGETEKD